jgi:hypothetical protein
MSTKPSFNKASLYAVSLAKVGNPLRGESLKTSKALSSFDKDDQDILTYAFLKPFLNIEPYLFHHHHNLELNEMNAYAKVIFSDQERFLTYSRKIARHLYDKTKHPNIKSGDLCIAFIRGIQINGQYCHAISIVKSEILTPFLDISDSDGDLQINTYNGISPDKIDKGCLIVDYASKDGYRVYTFDKGGNDTNFWVRDFLGARPLKDDSFKTKKYVEMCVNFTEEGLPENMRKEDKFRLGVDAMQHFADTGNFCEESFKECILKDSALSKKFSEYRENYKDEVGEFIESDFKIDAQVAKKAGAKIKSNLHLDSGVTLKFSPDFAEREAGILERGYDEKTQMNFIKVYFNEEA